ncbi:MAG: hypothetical protein JOY61_05545, partial [Chloroflexi bacterium]|nr:hypothetical protein [Chloroflexota bacterium]
MKHALNSATRQRLRGLTHKSINWSLAFGVIVSVVLGGALGHSTIAQSLPTDPSYFPATGYRITSPEIMSYFQSRGGVRTFGYPVSNEFPLLGQRVQLFQRQMLQLGADGNVTLANILDPDILPITSIDGLILPAADPDIVSSAPTPDSPDFATQALSFISVYVPDDWNGLPVKFQTTFLNTLTCADLGQDSCDPSQLAAAALEIWGLPTSLPTSDPMNNGFVYQRFQRGVMHFSAATGATQGLLVGDWLKRVMIGVDLPSDLSPSVRQSRFFAQYAPSRPLAVDRPNDLPDTSLAQAFHADTLTAAQQFTSTPVLTGLPIPVAETATSVALTSTALVATQTTLQGSAVPLTQTAQAVLQTPTTAVPGQPPAQPVPGGAGGGLTPQPQVEATSSIPVVNVGCLGDEQMWFVPRKPFVGVHVEISVTSQRHHDARFVRLTGAEDAGPVTERQGPLGFVWTWTVVPTVEDFYQWTFYADGLRPCITSGFNAFAPLGATSTPTQTPLATNTPGTSTPTPTQTPVPLPSINRIDPSNGLACGTLLNIIGNNFGSPPSSFGTNAILIQNGQTFGLT